MLPIKEYFLLAFLLGIFNSQCEVLSAKLKYEPNWESLDKRPLPQWYDDAKVGIFLHWGVYSVPSYGNEWFWTNWQGEKVKTYVNFMSKNYKPSFTYPEFAKDFTAELFNPKDWAALFRESGAKYVVLTSKHHDGYALWPSTRSFNWNSKDVGPNLDIINELSSSIKKYTTLKFGLYYSLYEWFNKMYVEDRSHSFKTNVYVREKVIPELQEIISKYKPDILWADGDQKAYPNYWNSTEFLAWLYNSSPVRDTVVANDRWGIGVRCAHGDFYTCSDRYNPGTLQKHKWENAMSLDKTSWGHRFDTALKDFMTSEKLIAELVTTVSCGGNILINVGPTRHGTIQPIFEERLRDMGNWLKVNGEAIYDSRPWVNQNDTSTKGVWYTKKTLKTDRIIVYAIVLDYPYDTNSIDFYSLSTKTDSSTKVQLLGYSDTKIEWSLRKGALHISFPPKHLIDKRGLRFAWTFKIDIPK